MSWLSSAISSVTKSFTKEVLDDVLGYDIPKPVKPIAAATPAGILPGATPGQAGEALELDVATTSYLETQEYLALQRQKALVQSVTDSGIISKREAAKMAMPPAKKTVDFRIMAVIMIVLWGISRWR